MRKNVAGQIVGAQMTTASDGSNFTGTVTVVVTGDGGTQGAGGGTVTHEGNGFHTYTPTQAETNFDHAAFTFSGTGAITVTVQVYTRYDANLTHINNGSTSGNNATLSLAQLNIVNSGGVAVVLEGTTSGLTVESTGAGSVAIDVSVPQDDSGGIAARLQGDEGGTNGGRGLQINGGFRALDIHGIATGLYVNADSFAAHITSAGNGMTVSGGNNYGIQVSGSPAGMLVTGDNGMLVTANVSGGIGARFDGSGSGAGVSARGGTTGHGLSLTRGATSGDDLFLANEDAPTLAAIFFNNNSTETYATAVAGSVVKEIVDNTPGGTGASLSDIADAVWDEARSGHTTAGTFGQYTVASLEFIGGTALASATLNLKKLNISNSDLGGVAVQLTATNSGTGMDIDGALTGIRIDTTGGPAVDINASANGIDISAGGGGASLVLGHVLGYAIYAEAAAAFNGPGVQFVGGGGGAGGDGFALTSGHANADPMTLDGVDLLASFFLTNTGQTYSSSVAGSVVKEIADNASAIGASDPLLNPVPGSYPSGTAGHVLGSLTGVEVTVVSPVSTDGALTLVRGDAYTSRIGRALTFTDTAGSWPDLTDAVVTLEVGDGELTVTGIVITATGSSKQVRVEPRSTDTEELTEPKYDYRLVATFPGTGTTASDGGDRATLVSSTVTVVDREDA